MALKTNDQLVYNVLCLIQNFHGFTACASAAEAKEMYPHLFALSIGEDDENNDALISAISADLVAGEYLSVPVAITSVIATADASDLGSTVTLANACKSKINALILAMRDAGLIAQ